MLTGNWFTTERFYMVKEINHWSEVPDGAMVIEDTYNEVYEVFTKDGQKWLRHVDWQYGNQPIPVKLCDYGSRRVRANERPCDFEPNALMDQPWYRIS